MKTEQEALQGIVNGSGYVFQVAVGHLIARTAHLHHWNVLVREHPWKDQESGQFGFIDLVLGRQSNRIVVETKRTQEAHWIFLRPPADVYADPPPANRVRARWVYKTPGQQPRTGWHDFRLIPQMPEAEFCIVRGSDEKSYSLLERIASRMVLSLESLVLEEVGAAKSAASPLAVYFPVLVTNTRLHLCHVNPDKVSLDTGKVDSANFEEVPYICFRKTLAAKIEDKNIEGLIAESNMDRQRSVLVVNAKSLPGFLKDLSFEKIDRYVNWPWDK